MQRRKRVQYLKVWHDYYVYKFFCYHFKLFGSLIFRGNKLRAFDFLFFMKRSIKISENMDPNFIFLVSMMNMTPKINLFLLKLGGSISKVPLPLYEGKQTFFAVKWLKILSKDKNRAIKISKMVDLVISALYNDGDVIQKKLEVYNIASNNRYLLNRYFK